MNELDSLISKLDDDGLEFTYTKDDLSFTLPDTNAIFSSIATVDEISTGLSLTMPESGLLTTYHNVLDAQAINLANVGNANNRFSLESNQFNNVLTGAIAPLSAIIADIGIVGAKTNSTLDFNVDNAAWLHSTTQAVSGICLNAVSGQQSIVHNILNNATVNVAEEINFVADSVRMISSGLNSVLESLSVFPDDLTLPSLAVVKNVAKVSDKELTEYQEKLDNLLYKLEPVLVERRIGCWETFRKKGHDYIGQSTSSMRRLVDQVLRVIAPIDNVKESEYYKISPGAKDEKGRPTRRARIFYAVGYDANRAEHLIKLTEGLLATYDQLSAWDHEPLEWDNFVEGAFVAIEGHLISLLAAVGNRT